MPHSLASILRSLHHNINKGTLYNNTCVHVEHQQLQIPKNRGNYYAAIVTLTEIVTGYCHTQRDRNLLLSHSQRSELAIVTFKDIVTDYCHTQRDRNWLLPHSKRWILLHDNALGHQPLPLKQYLATSSIVYGLGTD